MNPWLAYFLGVASAVSVVAALLVIACVVVDGWRRQAEEEDATMDGDVPPPLTFEPLKPAPRPALRVGGLRDGGDAREGRS